MWPFSSRRDRAVVVFHIDADGKAKGAFFRGHADVLIVDERDRNGRAFQMTQQTPDDELRRRIGNHPLARELKDAKLERMRHEQPMLNLHWRTRPEAVA